MGKSQIALMIALFLCPFGWAQQPIWCRVTDQVTLDDSNEVLWQFENCAPGVVANFQPNTRQGPNAPAAVNRWPVASRVDRLDGRQWLVTDQNWLVEMIARGRGIWRPTLDVPLTPATISQLNALSQSAPAIEWNVDAPDDLLRWRGQYVTVRGVILDAEKRDGRWFFNFGENYRDDLTLGLRGMAEEHFRALHGSPRSLIGSRVIVSGIIERFNGPFIEIDNGWQLVITASTDNQ